MNSVWLVGYTIDTENNVVLQFYHYTVYTEKIKKIKALHNRHFIVFIN
jgi:hypothetical protein